MCWPPPRRAIAIAPERLPPRLGRRPRLPQRRRPTTASSCRSARTSAGRCSSRTTPSSASIRAGCGPLCRLLAAERRPYAHQPRLLRRQSRTAYKGYGPDCWGLTASDNPDGYDAHAPGQRPRRDLADRGALVLSLRARAEPCAALRHFHGPPRRPPLGRVRLHRRLQRDAAGTPTPTSPSTRARSSS